MLPVAIAACLTWSKSTWDAVATIARLTGDAR
jgi:hypothetical protein